jgi:hypothetical protein
MKGKFLIILILMLSVDATADNLSVDKWRSAFHLGLAKSFCAENQFFRKCFDVTEAECLQTATRATDTCLASETARMPATVDEVSGRTWGKKVGGCAGGQYQRALASKMKHTEGCFEEKGVRKSNAATELWGRAIAFVVGLVLAIPLGLWLRRRILNS